MRRDHLGEQRFNLLRWGDGVGTGLERKPKRSGTDIFVTYCCIRKHTRTPGLTAASALPIGWAELAGWWLFLWGLSCGHSRLAAGAGYPRWLSHMSGASVGTAGGCAGLGHWGGWASPSPQSPRTTPQGLSGKAGRFLLW